MQTAVVKYQLLTAEQLKFNAVSTTPMKILS